MNCHDGEYSVWEQCVNLAAFRQIGLVHLPNSSTKNHTTYGDVLCYSHTHTHTLSLWLPPASAGLNSFHMCNWVATRFTQKCCQSPNLHWGASEWNISVQSVLLSYKTGTIQLAELSARRKHFSFLRSWSKAAFNIHFTAAAVAKVVSKRGFRMQSFLETEECEVFEKKKISLCL